MEISADLSNPYLLNCKFRYDIDLINIIKSTIYAARWVPETKTWQIPIELAPCLLQRLQESGIRYVANFAQISEVCETETQFRAGYQHLSVNRALASPAGYLFNFPPGAGKTAAAIETLKLENTKHALIVCPAMVRRTWLDEFTKWWPAASADVYVVSEGARKTNSKSAKETLQRLQLLGPENRSFVITSYGLLSKLPEEVLSLQHDAIVFDEIHVLQDPKTKQYKAAQEIVARWPSARRYGLTGTLFTNGIINAWGPLSTLFPNRYGSRHAFGNRYCQAYYNGYGWEYPGVDKDNLEELRSRLALVSYRPTDEEINEKLPTITLEEVDEDETFDLTEWVKLQQGGGSTHLAVLTYNRDKAHVFGDTLAKLGNCVTITGEEVADKRSAHLAEVVAASKAIVVATISSIKIGHNAFANFPCVLFTDLSDNLEEMTQALLRFRRKGSKLDRVRGFVLTNKVTQPKALRLKRKVNAIAEVIKLGAAEASMQSAFVAQNEYTKEEWAAAIQDVLGSFTGDNDES